MAIVSLRKVYNDLKSTASGLGAALIGYKRNATTTTPRTTKQMLDRLPIDIREFGAHSTTESGYSTFDSAPAIQAAVDWCLNREQGAAPILIPAGNWRIDSPIIIAKKNVGNTDYDYVHGVELGGERASYGSIGTGSVIAPSYINKPALIIQFGRGTRLRDISFLGQNVVNLSNGVESVIDDDNFLSAGVRNNRYSPFCAVATDPFSGDALVTGGNAGNQYPGLSSWYIGTANSGCSDMHFDNCFFDGFACAVALSPCPPRQNGENLYFDRCYFQYSDVGLSCGQSQNRSVVCRNCVFIALRVGITSAPIYGEGTGIMPNVMGGQASQVKYLFDAHATGYGGLQVCDFYAESFLSIGRVAAGGVWSRPSTFHGCHFSLWSTSPLIDSHGYFSGALVHFDSCELNSASGDLIVLTCGGGDPILFTNCEFNAQTTTLDPQLVIVAENPSTAARFVACRVYDVSRNSQFSDNSTFAALSGIDDHLTWPGTEVRLIDGNAIYRSKPETPRRNVVQTNMVLDGNGGATFTCAAAFYAAFLRVGDTLVDLSGGAIKLPDRTTVGGQIGAYYGRVSAVSGTNITLDNVPESADNTHAVGLQWLPRWHQPSTGDTVSGSLDITNVTNVGTWQVGDRIRSDDTYIYDGAFITGISGTTVTISVAAPATGVGVRLYDADVSLVPQTDRSGNLALTGTILASVPVAAKVNGSGAPYAITAAESGKVFTNQGATAQNYYTLPTAVANLHYSWIVQDADGIRVTANTGDTIRIAASVSGSAGHIDSTTIGDAITLVAINATEWLATSVVGAGWSAT